MGHSMESSFSSALPTVQVSSTCVIIAPMFLTLRRLQMFDHWHFHHQKHPFSMWTTLIYGESVCLKKLGVRLINLYWLIFYWILCFSEEDYWPIPAEPQNIPGLWFPLSSLGIDPAMDLAKNTYNNTGPMKNKGVVPSTIEEEVRGICISKSEK